MRKAVQGAFFSSVSLCATPTVPVKISITPEKTTRFLHPSLNYLVATKNFGTFYLIVSNRFANINNQNVSVRYKSQFKNARHK